MEAIGVRPAEIDAVALELRREVIKPVQALGRHLGSVVELADAHLVLRVRELVQPHTIDPVFGKAGGGELGGLLLRRTTAAIGEVHTPELHRGLVLELEVIADHAHAPVSSGRLVQPLVHADDTRAGVFRGRKGKPIRAGQSPDKRSQFPGAGHKCGFGRKTDRERVGARASLEHLRGQDDAHIAVERDGAGRVQGKREVASLLKMEHQVGGRRHRSPAEGQWPFTLLPVGMGQPQLPQPKGFVYSKARDEQGDAEHLWPRSIGSGTTPVEALFSPPGTRSR